MTAKKQMTWEKAVLKVLGDANEALHYQEIYRKIADGKMVQTRGQTPANTVAKTCSDLVTKNQARRPERGMYRINLYGAEATQEEKRGAAEDAKQAEKYPSRSYGLLWNRDRVKWLSYRQQKRTWNRSLRGKEHKDGEPIDVSEQPGIYLLHQHGRVMYVGQAEKLYERLSEHTSDHTSDRWNEFSWFGMGEVGKTNDSDDPTSDVSAKMAIDLMEAVLIEAIMPPLNKNRGNNLGTKYMQY